MGQARFTVKTDDLTDEQLEDFVKKTLAVETYHEYIDDDDTVWDVRLESVSVHHPDDRNVQTGQFTSAEDAEAHPDVTVHES